MAKILVVDDHPNNRAFLTKLLGYTGHELLEAANGALALEIARATQPDLVITDILMPAMDGYEFVRQLRTEPMIAQTEVIFCTAIYLDHAARLLARACGVDYILTNPALPDVVLSTVTAVLEQRQNLRLLSVATPADSFDREHARLLSSKLTDTVWELKIINERLTALLDLGLRMATERDQAKLIQICCEAARQIVGAAYAAISIRPDEQPSNHHFYTSSLMVAANGWPPQSPSGRELFGPLIAEEHKYGGYNTYAGTALDRSPLPHPQPSFLRVPIASALQRYGIIYLTDKLGGQEFSSDDERVATTLASQLAVAYENAQRYAALQSHAATLEQEVRDRKQLEIERDQLLAHERAAHVAAEQAQARLAFLAEATKLLGASLDYNAILANLVRLTLPFLGDGCLIDMVHEQGSVYRIALAHIIPAKEVLIRELWRRPPAANNAAHPITTVLQSGAPLLIADVPGTLIEQLADDTADNTILRALAMRSLLLLPIKVRGQTIGTLTWIVSESTRRYGADDLALAQELARRTSQAIENAHLYAKVRFGRERLQLISERLVQAQEAERLRIARELHDEVGQSLTAAQLNLQTLIGIADVAELPTRLEDSLTLIERVLQQVRTLSLDLRPSLLDDLGLAPALRWYVKRQANRAGFVARFSASQPHDRYSADLEITCFRIAQEAINNIMRYAQAKHVQVELSLRDAELQLRIEDDGVGFDVASALQRAMSGHSLGLLSMQERTSLLHGQIDIESTPGHGTTIFVRLPAAPPAGADWPIERRHSPR